MADFSCYITIVNNGLQYLTLGQKVASWGYWKIDPPATIAPQSTSMQFQLSDSAGPSGSEGSVSYFTLQGANLGFYFTDPFSGSDRASASSSSSNFAISFRCKSDGYWYNNSCPKSGHPITVEFTIDQKMPRRLFSGEENKLLPIFPNLETSEVWVVAPESKVYNCIAWSLGIDYTWIDPPSPISKFQTLYNTAADSTHGGVWKSKYNWQTVTPLSAKAVIDGWGTSSAEMTHGSRFYKDADFPSGVWSSKLGQYLLITHGRQDLTSTLYGKVLTSFIQSISLEKLQGIKDRYKKYMNENYFSEKHKKYIHDQVFKIDDTFKETFNEIYEAWEAGCSFCCDTNEWAEKEGFNELINLGAKAIPLYIEKMLDPGGFLALVPYKSVQDDISYLVTYAENDPYLFEGEQVKAVRTIELWLEHEYH